MQCQNRAQTESCSPCCSLTANLIANLNSKLLGLIQGIAEHSFGCCICSLSCPTILGPTPPQTPVLLIIHWRLFLPFPSSSHFALGTSLLCLKHPGRPIKMKPTMCLLSMQPSILFFCPLFTLKEKTGLWPWLSKRDIKKYPSWDLDISEEPAGKG